MRKIINIIVGLVVLWVLPQIIFAEIGVFTTTRDNSPTIASDGGNRTVPQRAFIKRDQKNPPRSEIIIKKDRGTVSGSTEVRVQVEEKAKTHIVEVNLVREQGGDPLYLGQIRTDSLQGEDVVNWNSVNTPDGSYELSSVVTTQDGGVTSSVPVPVIVKNEMENSIFDMDSADDENLKKSTQGITEKFIEDIKKARYIEEKKITDDLIETLKVYGREITPTNTSGEILSPKTISELRSTKQAPASDIQKVVHKKAQEIKDIVRRSEERIDTLHGDDIKKKKQIIKEIVDVAHALRKEAPPTSTLDVQQDIVDQYILKKKVEEGIVKLEEVVNEEEQELVTKKNSRRGFLNRIEDSKKERQKEIEEIKKGIMGTLKQYAGNKKEVNPDLERLINEQAEEIKRLVVESKENIDVFRQSDEEKKKVIIDGLFDTALPPVDGTSEINIQPGFSLTQDSLKKKIEEGVSHLERIAIEQQQGIVDTENFSVDTIEVAEVIEKPDGNKSATKITFKGRSLPNSFATLYIFSLPIVVTVKTDNDGYWKYTLDKELDDGKHKVFVALTDVKGAVVAKSKLLPFIKEAQAISIEEINPIDTRDGNPDFFKSSYFYGITTIIILSLIGILILFGIKSKESLGEVE